MSNASITSEEARAGRREWTALAVLALPLLLVSMDVAVLYFAVPFISRDLHATATEQLWIFDSYGFVLAGLLVTMGALGDRVGRRRLLLLGASAFGATSLLASMAATPGQLIAARALLGVAGASLMPSTLGIIRDVFHHPADRARAIGVWSGVMTGGIALGPVISGALLEHFWWGSVFLINVPAMLLLLALGPALLPASRPTRWARFDLASSALSLLAVVPAVFAIKRTATEGFDGLAAVTALAGVLAAAAFVLRQRRAAAPMVDLSLLTSRLTGSALVANLVTMGALVGNALYITQYLQLVLGMSPLRAALWSLVPSVGVAAVAPAAATMAGRVGRAAVMTGGFVVGAMGYAVLATLRSGSPLAVALVGAGLLAMGLVAVMSVVTEAVIGGVSPERAGTASAVSESTSELGGALGVAVMGSIGAAIFRHSMDDGLPVGLPEGATHAARESLATAQGAAANLPGGLGRQVSTAADAAFLDAMSAVSLAGALLLLAGAAFVWVRLRPVDQVGKGPLPRPEEDDRVPNGRGDIDAVTPV
ncbi:MAG TPA: MFS transporter [Dermatophilaceae bacterium]|nr:MFS transporter [Dermatophilaceae bacterium]